MLASTAISPAESDATYARDPKGRSTFLSACLENNQAEKEALLKRGLHLDLHEAAAAGDSARIEHLLTRSPGSVNHRDLEDATPLHWAAACGQVAIANLLLMKGADLGATAEGLDNATPAHFAASVGDHKVALQVLETLVGNGAPAGAPRTDGSTPLHIAAAHGHADAVRLLIRRGADPVARLRGGEMPLETATGDAIPVLRNASSIVRDCQTARFHGNEAYGLPQSWINEFVIAAHFDFEKIRKLHAQCKDLLLTRSTWDEIAVEAASHVGREDMANFLIDKGSPVSLSTACVLGRTGEVKKLLAEDPRRVHERGAHDFPAIWYTAFGAERPDMLELLVASGADIGAGMMGNTIVQLAERKKYNRLLEIARTKAG